MLVWRYANSDIEFHLGFWDSKRDIGDDKSKIKVKYDTIWYKPIFQRKEAIGEGKLSTQTLTLKWDIGDNKLLPQTKKRLW